MVFHHMSRTAIIVAVFAVVGCCGVMVTCHVMCPPFFTRLWVSDQGVLLILLE